MSFEPEPVEVMRVPVFLDNDSEMQVAIMLINREYIPDFNACPPVKTHTKQCPQHGRELSHYSIPSTDKPRKSIKIEVHL